MKKNNNLQRKIKSYRFGILAEFITIIFLWIKGYKILARRYKTYCGEIDIIAKKHKTLIAVEVKARKNFSKKNGFLIDEVITKNQQKRIKNSMVFFVKINYKKYQNYNIRFDLVVICPYQKPFHLTNFWE